MQLIGPTKYNIELLSEIQAIQTLTIAKDHDPQVRYPYYIELYIYFKGILGAWWEQEING